MMKTPMHQIPLDTRLLLPIAVVCRQDEVFADWRQVAQWSRRLQHALVRVRPALNRKWQVRALLVSEALIHLLQSTVIKLCAAFPVSKNVGPY